jgi:hypothetical protein
MGSITRLMCSPSPTSLLRPIRMRSPFAGQASGILHLLDGEHAQVRAGPHAYILGALWRGQGPSASLRAGARARTHSVVATTSSADRAQVNAVEEALIARGGVAALKQFNADRGTLLNNV